MREILLSRPTGPLSRRQLIVGCFGLILLAAIVIVHAIAITVFMWAVTAKPGGVVALTLLWIISAVAIFFISQGLRHAIARWRQGAL